MILNTRRILVLFAILVAVASLASGQVTTAPGNGNGNGPSENSAHLTVLSAQTDSSLTYLHVTGRNFCAFPSVTLGGTPLSVQATSSTSFDALLPVGIQPGTYLLEVSCGNGAVRNDTFVVTIQ